jgi:FdrA protein
MTRVAARVLRGRYVDSVVLMRLAQALAARDGVADAAALMGTEANKRLLAEGGFSAPDAEGARADDLVVTVKAEDDVAASAALAAVDALLETTAEPMHAAQPRTIAEALELQPGTNLVSISLPGEYAVVEARRALEAGRHVFLFSSNVSLADELSLKRLAASRGLLCMGPDCGTAIVDGKGLGFANALRRGPVGIVGASGTGIQALTCLLDRAGVGITHAIGCGGRDLRDEVGGATAFAALRVLLADSATEVAAIVAKPPGPKVAVALRALAAHSPKPIVLCLLGEQTIDDSVSEVLDALGRTLALPAVDMPPPKRPGSVVGLYSGGSLALEARLLLPDADIRDLGAEEYVRGRPHPMIDPRERRAQLLAAASDDRVGLILLDIVLGYGAAADPAGDLAAAIAAASRDALVFASVCGTERDPQGRSAQEATLRSSGAVVFPTNAAAAHAAALAMTAVAT